MKDKVFLDTNVVLYALDKSSYKQEISMNLLKSNPIISTQVLNEFSNICTRHSPDFGHKIAINAYI